jgi:hypothetical protein
MKLLLVFILALSCIAAVVTNKSAAFSSQDIPKETKVQPKEVVLAKDSQSDKYGEVAFNHENHSIKKYTVDGAALISCTECHHTDQPASALTAPLKTSERQVALTTAALAAADAKPVKSCRFCHLQSGDDSGTNPTVTYSGKTTPTKLTNEVAYHTNCNVCHDKAIAARPALKGKIPGSNDCATCHKPLT